MAAAERQRLRRVVSRFKKDELPGALRWLGIDYEVSKRRSKRDIISSALDTFTVSSGRPTTCQACRLTPLPNVTQQKNRVSEHAITELELQCKLASIEASNLTVSLL